MTDEQRLNVLEALAKSGMSVGQLIIENSGTNTYNDYRGGERKGASYSDEQVATALANIVGKGKPINAKWKWAGAIWLLQWACNYPSNTRLACERINSLPLPEHLDYECDYRNVRELATLSFFSEDARHLDKVKYSKNDEGTFREMKNIVVALDEELQKTTAPTPFPDL